MSKQGIVFILSGPSGVGKTTIERLLLKNCKNLKSSVSITTRARRKGERNGKDYFFLSKDEFIDLKQKDGLLESAKVFDNFYATPKEYVLKTINKGIDILLTIDVKGALQAKRKLKQNVVMIFILPPKLKDLNNRLKGRATDSKDVVLKRIALAKKEIAISYKYDYVVVNDKINKAVNSIINIINVEKMKTNRNKEIINGLCSS